MSLLEIRDLRTSFFTHVGEVQAVRGVNIHVERSETIGLVGESGCGKSVMMMSVMRLLDDAGRVVNGQVLLENENILALSEKKMEKLRGNAMSMIFQDPMTSLNPVLSIGDQMTEHLRLHKKINRKEAAARVIEMFRRVGIADPEKRLDQYPHEFSGGMRQRAMIAMALVTGPRILIADEPTTALDVTTQAQILTILKDVNRQLGTATILITHDLGVVADIAARVYVMYGGIIVEEGSTVEIFARPAHPYTQGLLGSVPNPEVDTPCRLVPIEGSPPDLIKPPEGCPFCARCKQAMEVCARYPAPVYSWDEWHKAACWLYHPYARKGRA